MQYLMSCMPGTLVTVVLASCIQFAKIQSALGEAIKLQIRMFCCERGQAATDTKGCLLAVNGKWWIREHEPWLNVQHK